MSKNRICLPLSALFLTVLFAAPAPAAWFLKADGLPGQSNDAKHSGWIELESFSLGGRPHTALGPGHVEANKTSKGSGKMFLKFTFKLVAVKTVSWAHDDETNGKHVPRAVVEGTRADGQVYVRFVLHDAVISGLAGGGGGREGAIVSKSMALDYASLDVEDLEPPPTPTPTRGVVKPAIAAPKR